MISDRFCFAGIFKFPAQRTHSKTSSRPRIRVRDSQILSSPVQRPCARACSSAGPPPAPSLVRARRALFSTPMPECRPVACLPARTVPGSSESGSLHASRDVVYPVDSQTDHSPTLRSNRTYGTYLHYKRSYSINTVYSEIRGAEAPV